jgi:HTH-type transcriptional regulator/antitoxin HigA
MLKRSKEKKMEFSILKTEQDYEKALEQAYGLMDSEPDTKEAENLEVLSLLIENFEKEAFPIEAPTLIEALKFRMEQQGLKQSDLAKLLKSKSRASEILNGKRLPTLKQASILHREWHIPAKSIFA